MKDILGWDIKSWLIPLIYWDNNINWNNVKNCLEIGGREGGLSLWLSLKSKNVICSDLVNVKEIALPLHHKYNVTSFIDYQDINALDIPYENHFDVIVFKSVLGGIGSNYNKENQERAIEQMHKALKPGGKLLFAENLTASPLHRYFRKRFINWGNRWRYVTINEMGDFLKSFSRVNIYTTGFLATLGRNEQQRKFLAFFDKALFNKVVPKHWKYIVYGIAQK